MKKILTKTQYRLFKNELEASADRGVITQETVDDILTYYQEGRGINIIRVLVSIGSVLIGLGILLIVAGNWHLITNAWKLVMIGLVLTSSVGAAYLTHQKRPYTSMGLLYLSLLVYGAGIILIRDMFYLDLEESTIFLLWTAGALVLSSLHKDVILFLVAHMAAAIFLMSSLGNPVFFELIALVVLFFAGNWFFGYKKIVTAFSLLFLVLSVFYIFDFFRIDTFWLMLCYLMLGLLLVHVHHGLNRSVFRSVGLGVVGVAGVVMTFSDLWEGVININGTWLSVPFAIGLTGYMFMLISKKQVFPLIVIGALILRYYFDTLYGFMPRALFFVIGGLMILGIGMFIERYRKEEQA